MKNRNSGEQHRLRVHRDQLTTVGDLERFKSDLIQEIKNILTKTTSAPVKQWLKSTEVKRLLGISTGTLQTLRMNGSLSYSKVGGIMFYKYDEIIKLLESNEQR